MILWSAAGQEAKSDDFNGDDNQWLVIHWLGLPTRCFLQMNTAVGRSIFDTDLYMVQLNSGLRASVVIVQLPFTLTPCGQGSKRNIHTPTVSVCETPL
jgi:hypothetical protein